MKIWRSIKLNFMAGILVLLPIYLTYIIIVRLFLLIDGILNRLATRALVGALGLPLNENQVIYGLGFITLFGIILLAGSVARNFIGKRFIGWINQQLDQIPVIRGIYKTLRQIFEALFATNSEAFQRPVLIEYPRAGLYSLAFQTRGSSDCLQGIVKEEAITVFLPSTPNPTTGFVLVVPKSQVFPVNLSTEEALKWIISGGVISQEQKAALKETLNNIPHPPSDNEPDAQIK